MPVPQSPMPMTPPHDGDDHHDLVDTDPRLTFLIHEHQYLVDMTRFADQKAAFVFAFEIGAATLCYNLRLYDPTKSVPEWGYWNWLASAGLVLILVAAAVSVWTLLPRLLTHKSKGIVYFQHVSSFASHAAYASAVLASLGIDIVNELSSHCYTLAQIVQAKFARTKYSIYIGAIGSLLILGAAVGSTSSLHKHQIHEPLTQVDHAGAALIAAIDVDLPSVDLDRDSAMLGAELKSVPYKTLTGPQQQVLEKFRGGYLVAIRLTKLIRTASRLESGTTKVRSRRDTLELAKNSSELTDLRRQISTLLGDAHKSLVEISDEQ